MIRVESDESKREKRRRDVFDIQFLGKLLRVGVMQRIRNSDIKCLH